MADDMIHAALAGYIHGAIGGAVIDDQPLDLGNTRHLARQISQRRGEGMFLVEAGNLNDQFHRIRHALKYNIREFPTMKLLEYWNTRRTVTTSQLQNNATAKQLGGRVGFWKMVHKAEHKRNSDNSGNA